jgi:peptidoglycan/xylan/chitin deacetylase (PgdA/CDA1 family)
MPDSFAPETEDTAGSTAGPSVFLDPSGRRWRTTRVVSTAVLVTVLASLFFAAPKMWADPALDGQLAGATLSIHDTGPAAPEVGVGPLLRVLKVKVVNGLKVGFEPFTGQALVTLTGADAAKAGNAPYVIQNFGYSSTARKTISLTFDDGPDPKATPALLNVLSANKVPATFFVVGKNIAKYPEIVARMVREGHAVGTHTLTHPDIAGEPRWRAHLEMAATARVLRAVGGQDTAYWRMPYLGEDERSLQDNIEGLLRAQQLGYTLASQDFDTRDWEIEEIPGDSVADIPMPSLTGDRNITVLLHDAGGVNRQWTVDYVKKLIPYAKAHGYTFQTMPQVDPALLPGTHPLEATVWDYATLYVVKALMVWPGGLVSVLFLVAMLMVVLVGFGNAGLSWIQRGTGHRPDAAVYPDLGLPDP